MSPSDNLLQNPSTELRRSFVLPKETSTMKVKLRDGEVLETATLRAFRYVLDNTDGITRIEFRYGKAYIVVARLKEDQTETE